MSSEFDPYHKWLGISRREQPPNHYRLLAIDLFEDDQEVIDASANRQMSYLQDLASGPNLKNAQKLLNEVAAARLCLLDAKRKAEYDTGLRQTSPPSRATTAAETGQSHDNVVRLATDGTDANPLASSLVSAPKAAVPDSAAKPPRPRSTPSAADGPQVTFGPSIQTGAAQDRVHRSGAHSTARAKNKNPHIAIALSLAAVVIVGALGAILYARSHGTAPEIASSALQSPSGDEDGIPSIDWNETSGRSSIHAQEASSQRSDIPLPGSNSSSDGVPPPPETHEPPPKPVEKPSGNTGSIEKAFAALQNRNIEQMKAELNKFLAANPQSARASEARKMLEQANFATSDQQVSAFVMKALKRHSKEEIRRRPGFEFPWPPIHPLLFGAFQETANRVYPHVRKARLALADDEKRGGNKPGGEQPAKPPKKDEPAPDPPNPEPPPESEPKPEITDPAELLASLGLVQSGPIWHLRDEDAIQERLADVATLYKQWNDARKEISPAQRGQFAQLQRKLKADEAKATEMRNAAIEKGVISGQEAAALKKADADVNGLRLRIQAAEDKVNQVDSKIADLYRELLQQLEGLDKTLGTLDDTFRDLQTNDAALDAINGLGGRLGRASIVGTARSKLKRFKGGLADAP